MNLLDKLHAYGIKSELSTSYDFTGRPVNEIKKSVWYKNLRFFHEYIYTIGFVLTKPSIRRMLKDEDEFFKELYASDYTLYFDYYVPEKRMADVLMPSDRDQLQAFLFIAEHYPKVYPVADWIHNQENKLTCFSTNKITILQDGREVTCRYLQYKDGDFKNKVDYSSNDNIIHNWLQEKQCHSCEYFGRCSLTCFVQADWTKKETMDICLYKNLYKTLDQWKASGYGPYNKANRKV
jgi:radical SAM protein with 4Fe4S-binding SPASM domain